MIKKYVFLILFFPSICFAQEERYPVFDVCKGAEIEVLKECFYTTARKYFFAEFTTPTIVENEKFNGIVNTIFSVSSEGNFKLIYVNTPYEEIREEENRMPKRKITKTT